MTASSEASQAECRGFESLRPLHSRSLLAKAPGPIQGALEADRALLVPNPREHQWTDFGVLAPASPLRDAVVPRRTVPSPRPSPGPRPAPGIGEPEADPCAKAQRQSWAELLQRTFAVDVLRCPTCGGRRHRVATLTDPLIARRILKHLRLRAEPPPLAPARPEPQLRFA